MYDKRLTLKEILENKDLLSEMDDTEVYQVTRGGTEPKVIMTQEHYFYLLTKIEQLGGTNKRTPFEEVELMEKVNKILEEIKSSR
jgi:hypothetical protein